MQLSRSEVLPNEAYTVPHWDLYARYVLSTTALLLSPGSKSVAGLRASQSILSLETQEKEAYRYPKTQDVVSPNSGGMVQEVTAAARICSALPGALCVLVFTPTYCIDGGYSGRQVDIRSRSCELKYSWMCF